ncbi:Type III secretion cytoplasmic LcrG inhibitor [Vibrio sp. IB15]|uniref:Type III secretion cytoplasmic LcrG inhibitor n=1 Tax=Vibrio chagasii TaxID=170679 RepID=A0A7V7TEZ3_9VIBR|nr:MULTISPECIES: virulence-associated V antigen [Vibrio]KAB0470340.1 Type III secretion cytoplasmic LcrG inhibitor [Vibrio chagasii]MBJ2147755.1 Type III secretion cytoplasmic LcrG inhibitor [Vibrio sp. IB15]
MTDMTTMNSISGVLNTTANRDSQIAFQQGLVKTFSPILSDAHIDVNQLESLIRQLPIVVGRTEQESLSLYADSLDTLLKKQEAFTGTAATETTAHWMRSLQQQALNGQIAPKEVEMGVNTTLAHQFQSWFSTLLKDKVDSSLSTDFIADFRLGSQSNQALQIQALNTSALKAAMAEISSLVNTLAVHMRTSEVRENAIPFLRNAFTNLGSVNLNELKNSDYFLTEESFRAAVADQLVASFNSIGITISTDDAKALANKIAWIPGMSKQELTDAINSLAIQLKGQFENAYGAEGVKQLKAILDLEVDRINADPNAITLPSLFSNIAIALINTQIDKFFNDLLAIQVTQTTPEQLERIKQNTEQDIRFLFEKIVAGKDIGTDFVTRHQKMMENLYKLSERLAKITAQEVDSKEVNAEHALTARDLLAVIESSIGDRFDERVLFALNERRVDRLEKRNILKGELENLTMELRIFGAIQSKIHSKQSAKEKYEPGNTSFQASDFGYDSEASFKASPEYAYLTNNKFENHKDFLTKQGVSVAADSFEGDQLASFSNSVSDQSKVKNDTVQLKTTELSDISSQYNATVEAMNKFVQKYHSILQEILRAL